MNIPGKYNVTKVKALEDFTLHGKAIKKGDVFTWASHRASLLIRRNKVELYTPPSKGDTPEELPKEKVCVSKVEKKNDDASTNEDIRISPRTGKPMRKYTKKVK